MGKIKNEKLLNRVIELDVLRFIAVVLMVFDHLMFNLWGLLPSLFSDYPFSLYQIGVRYWDWEVRIILRYFILFIFLGVSGICCSFSKSNLNRGCKLMCVALLLTFATSLIGDFIGDSDLMITFGVLHCIALALILIGLLEKITKNKWVYLAIGIIMVGFGLYFEISSKYGNYQYYNDTPFYKYMLEQIIGLKSYGSDSFAFLLNGGQIFIGVFLGKLLYANKKSLFKNKQYKNNFMTFIGRNSLFVYLLHQVILPVLLSLILLIFGYNLAI